MVGVGPESGCLLPSRLPGFGLRSVLHENCNSAQEFIWFSSVIYLRIKNIHFCNTLTYSNSLCINHLFPCDLPFFDQMAKYFPRVCCGITVLSLKLASSLTLHGGKLSRRKVHDFPGVTHYCVQGPGPILFYSNALPTINVDIMGIFFILQL